MPDDSPDMKIWLALKSRLVGLAAITGLTIEWPNESFTAPSVGYLRVRHVPNTPLRPFLGSDAPHERMGLVQVMSFSKRGGAAVAGVDNTARALRAASQVAGHFPTDLSMRYEDVTVRVMRAPRVGEVVNPPSSAYAECAVEIPYRCFA